MTGTSSSLRDRFMGAFIDIEDHMKRLAHGPRSDAPDGSVPCSRSSQKERVGTYPTATNERSSPSPGSETSSRTTSTSMERRSRSPRCRPFKRSRRFATSYCTRRRHCRSWVIQNQSRRVPTIRSRQPCERCTRTTSPRCPSTTGSSITDYSSRDGSLTNWSVITDWPRTSRSEICCLRRRNRERATQTPQPKRHRNNLGVHNRRGSVP